MRQREFKLDDMPADVRARVEQAIATGDISQGEADEAMRFMDELAERELRGEVTQEEALQLLVTFSLAQVARRAP